MNAQELFFKDGKTAGVWYCQECKIVAKAKDQAEACCKRPICKYCNIPVETQGRFWHSECLEENRIKTAEKLKSWDGWVYLQDYASEFFSSVSDLIDEIENDGGMDIPEFVFVCTAIPFKAPDIEWIIEKCTDDHHEEAADSICGEVDLSIALKEFEVMNQHIVSYVPDFSRMVRTREE